MAARRRKATYSGRQHFLTLTQWAILLDVTTAKLEKWIHAHNNSLQQAIDIELAEAQRRKQLVNRFIFGKNQRNIQA